MSKVSQLAGISPRDVHILWVSLSNAKVGGDLGALVQSAFPEIPTKDIKAVESVASLLEFAGSDSSGRKMIVTRRGRGFGLTEHWRLWAPPKTLVPKLKKLKASHLFIPEYGHQARPQVIDLFSGVGGLGLGFEAAGFGIAVAVDNDPEACEAHRANFPSTAVYEGDIKQASSNPVSELCKPYGLSKDDVVGVVGGPPCQGFSYIGERVALDERNLLTTDFVKIVRGLEPEFFLMENVAGLKSSGLTPAFDVHMCRLAKPIGEPATLIVDLLPKVPTAVAKRDRQYRKRLVSNAIMEAKEVLKEQNPRSESASQLASFTSRFLGVLRSQLAVAIESAYSGECYSEAEVALNEAEQYVGDLAIACVLEYLLQTKCITATECETTLKELVKCGSLDPDLEDCARRLISQYDNAPQGGIRNGEAVGPILMHIMDALSKDYSISGPRVLSAAEYGAPQNRRRLFLVGIRKDLGKTFDFPTPTHSIPTGSENDLPTECPSPTTEQAIGDLPDIDKYTSLVNGHELPSSELSRNAHAYGRLMRLSELEELNLGFPRPDWNPFVLGSCKRTMHAPHAIARIRETGQGNQDKKSHRTRLSRNKVSHTLRAGTREGKGSHTAVRPIHYEHDRVISVREGARLMGYPDWMKFHPTKWHGFRLVGNGVPYQIGKALATEIASTIFDSDEKDTKKSQSTGE